MGEARFAHTLFCDDVRQEIGGKLSFMGAYPSGDCVLAAEPPTLIAQLCLVFWINTAIDDPIGSFTVRVAGSPLGPDPLEHDADVDISLVEKKVDATRVVLMGVLSLSPVNIVAPGRILVTVDTHREILKAGSLDVLFKAPESRRPARKT